MLLFAAAGLTAAAQAGGWLLVKDAVDNGMRAGDERRLWIDVGIYVAINAISWALGSYVIRGLAAVGQGIVLELRRHLFRHLTTLSLRYFSQTKAGWIIARLTSDVDALSDVLSEGLKTLIANTLTFIVAIVALFALDWRLALVALTVMPPALLFSRWFQVRSRGRVRRGAQPHRRASPRRSPSRWPAWPSSRRSTASDRSARRSAASNEREPEGEHPRADICAVFFPAIEWLGVLATGAVLWVGTDLVDDGTATLGTVIAFIGLLGLLFQPLQELSELYGQVQSAAAAMVKIAGILDTETDIASKEGAEPIPRIEGRIDLDGVTFAYGAEPVLHALDVHVPAGGCLALVGESGGGKSTTAKLIARFYDPADGVVRVDGHRPARGRARELPPPARRRAAGPVPVLRHDRRQHPLRPARGHRRGGGGGGARDRRRRRRRAPRRRPRPRRPRGRRRACRPASGSSSRSPARCWPTRAS